jgi:1-aminocyclopropane-1-carboxylate deaminase/D-cysteine desulfhydrase-like pyridoxal-dependent ACC family enzyme
LSYVALGDFPTPVYRCNNLCAQFPRVALFAKHDGLTGNLKADGTRNFGGNKLRKLQYLLADALAHGHSAVLTFGCVGSNHALQTAVCAHALGLKAICMLRPQPNSHVVRRNLLLQKLYESIVCLSPDRVIHGLMTAALSYDYKQRYGTFPYIIPVGGSCARGALGYVEAAFELKEQIDAVRKYIREQEDADEFGRF